MASDHSWLVVNEILETIEILTFNFNFQGTESRMAD